MSNWGQYFGCTYMWEFLRFSSLCIRAQGLCCYRKVVKNYLTLTELGCILQQLSISQGMQCINRTCCYTNNKTISCRTWYHPCYISIFPFLLSVAYKLRESRSFDLKLLKTGSPNLLVVPKGIYLDKIIEVSVIEPNLLYSASSMCVIFYIQ